MISDEYIDFVIGLVSPASKNLEDLVSRLEYLDTSTDYINIPGMITGAKGLTCESAEVEDIIKKVVFQGKPLDEETLHHIKLELGDALFYFVLLCDALDTDPKEVMLMNIDKLSKRFTSGKFTVVESENRKEGDK